MITFCRKCVWYWNKNANHPTVGKIDRSVSIVIANPVLPKVKTQFANGRCWKHNYDRAINFHVLNINPSEYINMTIIKNLAALSSIQYIRIVLACYSQLLSGNVFVLTTGIHVLTTSIHVHLYLRSTLPNSLFFFFF